MIASCRSGCLSVWSFLCLPVCQSVGCYLFGGCCLLPLGIHCSMCTIRSRIDHQLIVLASVVEPPPPEQSEAEECLAPSDVDELAIPGAQLFASYFFLFSCVIYSFISIFSLTLLLLASGRHVGYILCSSRH